METKEAKTVGEVFDLLIGDQERDRLAAIAALAVPLKNAVWLEWRMADPVSVHEALQFKAAYREYGKAKKAHADWAKNEKKGPEPQIPDKPTMRPLELKTARCGVSWSKWAGSQAPELMSYVTDAIANRVSALYRQNRLAYLTFDDRVPFSDQPQILFREKACRIVRDERRDDWYRVVMTLDRKGPMSMAIRPKGASPHTRAWLAEMADSGAFPSGGMISARRRRGKRLWQISLSRVPREGENQTTDPVAGRTLIVWAPPDQQEFLRCEVSPINARPWRITIEGHDLLRLKRRADDDRRRMGRNYHQSPASASHGHGRERAIRGKLQFAGRYARRVKDWIENRSMEVARFAVETRCESVMFENLSARDPSRLLLGDFEYYTLVNRMVQKCRAAGLKTSMFTDLETIKRMLGQTE